MKKLIYTITIILFCGALAIANNKINKLENQIESLNNKEVVQAAAETGDYEIEASNQIELINIIKTYMVNKYNMLESEVNQNDIFKNDILAYTPAETEENQEQQSGYTEEDYNKYLEYKEGLIKEYGEEIYNLMNQEAGIKTEEESFEHFMEYGI